MYEPTQLETNVRDCINKADIELRDAFKFFRKDIIDWPKVEEKLIHARHAIQCALNEIKETE